MTIAQTIGRVNAKIETTNRSREFAEYAIALMRSKGNREMALHHADASGLSQRVRTAIKADIAGDTTSSADALAPYRNLSEGFAATLANVSAFDGVLADSIQVPLHTQLAVVTSDASAAVAGEGSGETA